jgi:BirA family biotin operon repressor/biotin-[acetyl-CoA-carboxylase] ligase
MNREATDLAGVRHIAYEALGSTNAEGLARARAGERGPVWISARTQDAGRGRRGGAWTSEPGNLYASLLLTDPAPPAQAPQLSFVAALALHDAVAECAAALGPMLALKWPNDLMVGGAKLAGILIEGDSSSGLTTGMAVVAGIGVNCVSHPSGTPYPATDLMAAGAMVEPQSLLAALAAATQKRLAQWDRGQGFAAIRAAWLKRAAGLGLDIKVRLPEREFTGLFEGLDDTGRLLVRGSAGVTTVTAGEVFGFGGE